MVCRMDSWPRSWELTPAQDVLHTGSAPKVAVQSITQRYTVSPSDYTRNRYHLREMAYFLLLCKTPYLTLGISCIFPWVDRGAPVWCSVYWSVCKEYVILPVVLYGCETCSLTLREERRLRVFENRTLRRVFGPKRDEVTWGMEKIT